MTIIFGIIFFVGWLISSFYLFDKLLIAVDEGDKHQMWGQVVMLTLDAMLSVYLFNLFRMMFSPVYYWYY